MKSLHQVWALLRSTAGGDELTEVLESLQPDEHTARQYAGQLAKSGPNVIRTRIRPATMTEEQIRAVFTQWGERDARDGRPPVTNGKYLTDYMAGYRKGRKPTQKPR